MNGLQTVRAWISIVLGAALAVGIGALTFWFNGIVNHWPGAGNTHWNGSPALTTAVFQLFATIILFGMVSLAGGIYQLRKKRMSRVALALMIILIIAMGFLGRQIVTTPPAM